MFSFILILILAITSAAANPHYHRNITEHNNDSPSPFTVAIFQPALVSRSEPFICSGVLISSTAVLTIAECVDWAQDSPSSIIIRTGTRPSDYQNISVASVTTHPSWNASTLASDVAVIHLAEEALHANPAVLSTADSIGADVMRVSWGPATNDTQAIGEFTRQDTVAVLDAITCAERLEACNFALDANHFCTEKTSVGQVYGDGGGPVVEDGHLVGLISGNPECAAPEGVALNVKLAGYNSWIAKLGNGTS